jgi:hypothetical protein
VHKQHGLCAALLAGARVGVLVTLPRDVVDVADIGAEDLPVKAGVLDLDTPLEVSGKDLSDA